MHGESPAQDSGFSLLLIFRGGGKMADSAAGVDVILAAGALRTCLLQSSRSDFLRQLIPSAATRSDLRASGSFQKLWQAPQQERRVLDPLAPLTQHLPVTRLRCCFAGCRAVGVRDRHRLLSDATLPDPELYKSQANVACKLA